MPIDPNNLPGNSAAEKRNPEKKIEKVIEGTVHRRKPTIGRRFAQTFFGQDAKGVVESVVGEVLVPALKATITDAISRGVEQLLFGNAAPRRDSYRSTQRTNYTNYSQPARRDVSYGTGNPVQTRSARRQASEFVDSITFETRVQAERVLDEMKDNLDRYGAVSVADFVEMCGEVPSPMDDTVGWHDLNRSNAYVRRLRNGDYVIELPRLEEIGTV